MSMAKKVKDSRDDVRAALVKALEAWSTPYDIAPDGVFGCVASVKCGDVTLSSEQLDIEVYVPFDDDMEVNEAEIKVYNISPSTLEQLKKGEKLTVEAGYRGDTGVIFSGYISAVQSKRDGADRCTTIKALDDIKEHKLAATSYKAGTKASYILKDLLDKTGMPIAVYKVRRDYTYEDAETVEGELMENISRYARVCGISVYVSRGKIYARYIKEGDNIAFAVSSDAGMVGSPAAYEEEVTAEDFKEVVHGYEVEMILQHRMCAGAIVDIKSRDAQGRYRVCSGEHFFAPDGATTRVRMY